MPTTEKHTIKNFRGTGLGIIRLDELAYVPDKKEKKYKMTITLKDGTQIEPKGFDTYGHPVISERAFRYYEAKKANAERCGESFDATVEYNSKPFCIKREFYDTTEAMLGTKKLKDVLILRKQAHFYGRQLNTFVLYNKYLLASNGHVYWFDSEQYYDEDGVVQIEDVDTSNLVEVHIPGEDDTCAICGKQFTAFDIKEFNIAENEKCEKIHRKCSEAFTLETEHQIASQIIDSVYDGRPESKVVREGKYTWYEYKTKQGTVKIRFKHKVIVLKWENNFKPFSVLKVFENERVTKEENENFRLIHAWSKDDAIRYLSMVKKA